MRKTQSLKLNSKKGVINVLMIVVVAILLASAVGFYLVNQTQQTNDEKTMMEEKTVSYTLEEVSSHDQAEDCWMAIDGKVYDVTSYIASEEHPAGKAILKGCGLDASEMFEGPHSEETYANLLPQFEIGILE